MKNRTIKLTAAILALAAMFTSLLAQAGGSFSITKSVINGGAQQASGGNFSLAGTVGQSIAGDSSSGGNFTTTSGFWQAPVSGAGIEGDVAQRFSGDGSILSNDLVQVRRFLNGTSSLDVETNEFQRADVAPRATAGDGMIASNDVVQTRRYLNATDATQQAAGPMFASSGSSFTNEDFGQQNQSFSDNAAILPRELRVESTNATAGQPVTVNIRVDAVGDEAEYGFVVLYDATKFSNPVIGPGNAGAQARFCNTMVAGKVNCSVGDFPDNNPNSSDPNIGEIHAGNNQILITITFNTAANAPSGPSLIKFSETGSNSPPNVSNDNADLLPISWQNGTVTISGPSAATVSISGRVMTADGRGIVNVFVVMTAQDGTVRVARSTTFGYYRFDEVVVGETYVFSVRSKRFRFAPQTITVLEEMDGLNFIAET